MLSGEQFKMYSKQVEEIYNKYKDRRGLFDEKKDQTTYKINYVSSYVKEWLYVLANRKEATTINFIDCMCNAGIYADGELGTPLKALLHMREFAQAHPDVKFNVFLNDHNSDRLMVITELVEAINKPCPANLTVNFSNEDVNDYIEQLQKFAKYCGVYNASTLLFVDPYNFGTVKINVLQKFLRTYYAELIFNVFTSDFVRNGKSQVSGKKIQACLEGHDLSNINNVEDLIALISKELTTGNIKHTFQYEFRTQTNSELYQIMFCTPNIKGIEQLKKALWEVFQGAKFHKNKKVGDTSQISLFELFPDCYDDEASLLSERATEARQMLMAKYAHEKRVITYNEISTFIQCRTMLKKSHIISQVLVPLIEEGKLRRILKEGKRSSNYTEADYSFVAGGI